MSLRPVWSTEQIPGHSELHRNPVSQTKQSKKKRKKKKKKRKKKEIGSEEQLLLYLSLFPNTHTGRLISVSLSHWNPFTMGTASSYEECRSDLQTYTFKGPVLRPFKGEF